MDDEREIPESLNVWLHQSLGMADHEILPKKLVDKFWELKRIFDRTGTIMSQRDIAFLTWQLGFGKPTEEEKRPPTIVDMWRSKQIKRGEKIEVNWRDKWMDAVFQGCNANDQIIAQPVGEADEQRFTAEQARVSAA